MTRVSFNISIVNDTVREGNESFRLTILNSSLPSGIIHGSPYVANITIVDTTSELLDFS